MNLGFIGAGNMARAIINGWQTKELDAEIYLHSAHKTSYEPYAKEKGLKTCETNSEVVLQANYVFLAVKPIILGEVLTEIKAAVKRQKPVIVSMVTGVSVAEIAEHLELAENEVEIVRIMPNVNAEIAEAMTALHANQAVTPAHFEIVQQLFELIGKTEIMAERDFSTFVALAGSSPAYVYFFIDAMARAGVKYGLKKEQATKIAAQAVLGSAKKVLSDEKTPMQLVDDVCSPGGTTIAGLLALEEAGFMTAVVKGMDATINKDQGKA